MDTPIFSSCLIDTANGSFLNFLSMTPTRLVLALAAPTNVIGTPDFSRIVQRGAAAVVDISVSRTRQVSTNGGDGAGPSFAVLTDLASKVVATLGGVNDKGSRGAKADDAVGKAVFLRAVGIDECRS